MSECFMKMKFGNLTAAVTLVLLSLAPLGAFARGGGDYGPGNGGDVVTCRNARGELTSVELLDLYEARTRWGLEKQLGPASLSLEEKVALLLQRLERRLPEDAQLFRGWFKTFFEEAQLLPGVQLVDVPDSNHIALPSGCAIEQIAIQREPEFSREKRYTLSLDLWNSLTTDGKAALVLHELIYRQGIRNGAQNSRAVRYVNALLVSDQFSALNDCEGLRTVQSGSLFWNSIWNGDKARLVVKQSSCSEDGELSGYLPKGSELRYADGKTSTFTSPGQVHWYANGQLKSINWDGSPEAPNFNLITVSQEAGPMALGDRVQFDPNGRVVGGSALVDSARLRTRNGTEVACSGRAYVYLAADGYLQGCRSSESVTLRYSGFTIVAKARGDWSFYEDGTARIDDLESARLFIEGQQVEVRYLKKNEDGDFEFLLSGPVTLPFAGERIEFEGYLTLSTENGAVLSGAPVSPVVTFSIQNQKVDFLGSNWKCSWLDRFPRNGRVDAYPSGQLRSGVLAKDTTLESVDGTLRRYRKYDQLTFAEDGRVESAEGKCR